MTNPDTTLRIEPSRENQKWVRNCVVIPEGATPSFIEIASIAAKNGAFIDNSYDEAGDDEYCVRFSGHKEELATYDHLRARIWALLG